MRDLKPSHFTKHPYDSVTQKSEAETVAANIMRILKRTGDTFRPMTPEEYTNERRKDGAFTNMEIGYFAEVIGHCEDAKSAREFSPIWEASAQRLENKSIN